MTHPRLKLWLAPYHSGEAVLTAVRAPDGGTGWMLSRDDVILTWDGWYSEEENPYAAALPLLLERIGPHDHHDFETLTRVNGEALPDALPSIWHFFEGGLHPRLLADRIAMSGRERSGGGHVTTEIARQLEDSEPLAYLVLGSPDDLHALADVLSSPSNPRFRPGGPGDGGNPGGFGDPRRDASEIVSAADI